MSAFAALTRAQAKGYLRDKQMLFWTILFPLIFLVIFTGVFGEMDRPKATLAQVGPVALFDQMPEQARRELDALFTITREQDRDAALDRVRKGELDGVVWMTGPTLTLRYSQADQVKAATLRGTLDSFVLHANLAAAGAPATISLAAEQVEDKSLKTIQFFTPGLLAWAVSMSGTFGAAMALVQWRQSKLLRRLRLSPVSTAAVVGSRTIVTLVVALVQAAIFLGVGVAFFGLRLSGSWWLATPVLLAGSLAFMSVGLLTGAVSKTPDGASGLANLVIIPMAFLSGTFFSVDQAPTWMRVLSQVLPMGHLNQGMSAVLVRGQGAEAIWLPILVLLGFAVVLGVIAARIFRWDND